MIENRLDFQDLPWDRVLDRWKEILLHASVSLSTFFTESDAVVALEPGKWSPKQIIGHLIDSAANNHQRFVRAQSNDDLVFNGYAQDDWVRMQDYQKAEWFALIDLWKAYNLHLHRICSLIPENIRTRLRTSHNLDEIAWQVIPKSKPATLDYLIRDYVGHLFHHLFQILPNSTFLSLP